MPTAQAQTGLRDAAIRGTGWIEGRVVAICVMDFGFMGGSMGAVVGEKVARAAEDALAERMPLVIVSASGGARMQEGTLALMQLAKTSAPLVRLDNAGVPFIAVLTDPTTGGVLASFASLGDVILAEPKALIGFAGARVAAARFARSSRRVQTASSCSSGSSSRGHRGAACEIAPDALQQPPRARRRGARRSVRSCVPASSWAPERAGMAATRNGGTGTRRPMPRRRTASPLREPGVLTCAPPYERAAARPIEGAVWLA